MCLCVRLFRFLIAAWATFHVLFSRGQHPARCSTGFQLPKVCNTHSILAWSVSRHVAVQQGTVAPDGRVVVTLHVYGCGAVPWAPTPPSRKVAFHQFLCSAHSCWSCDRLLVFRPCLVGLATISRSMLPATFACLTGRGGGLGTG